ncbi:alpha/beta-hydrolase [Aspergillus steynii IBT 23096]|uniref:Alpha/beta-hydrolase n=1 Tax=Aspergillus steynii IBT 23096 TaxID=1392250 RepID=A0A2I2G3I7_9EURO|nr:alpha/beta-hydrolase [Aspergillus steynii IBT 23096]PLB47417.1 alpha/beta-hydrolase [Aspergillus steynii IBT 23096]
MPPRELLSPGPHTFHSATKNLTFEYIVHTTCNLHPNAPQELLIIQPPAWGLGSGYLHTGLSSLLDSSPSSPSPGVSYTLLFFHPRGTDNSSRPASPTQMSSFELATDLDDLRRHLGLVKIPTLLGHSNGGAIALAYAELYPERVDRLVLVDSQVLGVKSVQREEKSRGKRDRVHGNGDGNEEAETDTDEDIFEKLRADPRYARVLGSAGGLNKSSDEAFTSSVNATWALYFSNPTRYVPELRSAIGDRVMLLWCYLGVYGSDREYEESGEMVARLGDVKAKTLIIVGREDWICRVSSAKRLRERIPGARLVICEECGHFPWIEAKERTIKELVEFIRGS